MSSTYPNAIYLGARGHGKSTLASLHMQSRDRVVYVDITKTVSMPGRVVAKSTSTRAIERYLVDNRAHCVIYHPSGEMGPGRNKLGIPLHEDGGPTGVYRLLEHMRHSGHVDTIVLDEWFALTGTKSQDMAVLEYIQTSRHDRTSVNFIVHRPVQIHPNIWGVADVAYVFKVQRKLDIDALNREWDGLGDKARRLPKFQYYIYDMTEGVTGPYAVPKPTHVQA